MSRVDEVFERLYAEAIYSSSLSACKRDMNDDLGLIEAELCRLRAEAELARELIEVYEERWEYVTECDVPNDVQVRFLGVHDAYDRLFPKEAE